MRAEHNFPCPFQHFLPDIGKNRARKLPKHRSVSGHGFEIQADPARSGRGSRNDADLGRSFVRHEQEIRNAVFPDFHLAFVMGQGIRQNPVDNGAQKTSVENLSTNTLGYGNDEVDEAVTCTIKNGNLSTLSCPEEVELAEKLIELNP